MKQAAVVAEQFGNTAASYLTSCVHAQGADLVAAVVISVLRLHRMPPV
jgi:hypothetical protein